MSRPTALERVHRILSILPWVMANQGVEVEKVCERFAIDEADLIADFDFVLNYVEVYPFTPDMAVEPIIDEGRVYVTLGDYFDRAPALTDSEALMMLSAAKMASRLHSGEDDDDTALLRSAIDKLEHALGGDEPGTVHVDIGVVDPDLIAKIRSAITGHQRLRIDYYTYGRDQVTRREIDPLQLINHSGNWYLKGFCHLAGDLREFRVDRIYQIQKLDVVFDAEHPNVAITTHPSRPNKLVRLHGPKSMEWVARTYAVEAVTVGEGDSLTIDIRAEEDQWLQRLLLRLPPEATAESLSDNADLAELRAEAARRILDRYDVD